MSYKSKQKMKAINKLALWTVLYLVLLIITLKLVSQTYYYDPGWAMFVLFIFLGLPLLIVGVVIMAIVLTRKIKNRYKVLIGFVIAIVMILIPSMFISHDIGLPNDSWEYNEELSKVYTLSRGGNFNGTLKYRVYVDMGENDNQDRRKARVYNNEGSGGKWRLIHTGIVKDDKLFINNWRVYPTPYVGISHLGENPEGSSMVVYLDNLTYMAPSYRLYFIDNQGNFLTNLSYYGVNVGDIIAVYGDIKFSIGKYYNYLLPERIEIVETLY